MFQPAKIFSSFPGLVAGQSTRHGGVSSAPYASLNLGLSTADSPKHVEENRRRFFRALGFEPEQTASSHQVHGDAVLHAVRPGRYDGYDAIVTAEKGLMINVSVADCTPVLIYDPLRRAMAAVHAGWKGTTLGITTQTLRRLGELFGTHSSDCYAYIGTCIDGCDYEVNADVALHFQEAFRTWDAARGKYMLNLKAANLAQLLAAGLLPENIEVSPYSTVTHSADYFSHRAEKGLTGRMLAVIGLKPLSLQEQILP